MVAINRYPAGVCKVVPGKARIGFAVAYHDGSAVLDALGHDVLR